MYYFFNTTLVDFEDGKGIPTIITALAMSSLKSVPSDVLPLQTASRIAPLLYEL